MLVSCRDIEDALVAKKQLDMFITIEKRNIDVNIESLSDPVFPV